MRAIIHMGCNSEKQYNNVKSNLYIYKHLQVRFEENAFQNKILISSSTTDS